NADSVVEALIEFGASDPRLNRDWFLEPGKVTRMGVPPVRLEILTAISGVDFQKSFANRIVADFDGVDVNMINLEDLRANKAASGRLKDLSDLEYLPGGRKFKRRKHTT